MDNDIQRLIDEYFTKINDQFNSDIQKQLSGTLESGHIYMLGYPSPILLSAGIPNLPIEMASSRLRAKSTQIEHPFELSEIKGLVKNINNPLAVFRSATHIGSNVILTELQHNSKSFVIAIETNRAGGKLKINSIRSIHYRNSEMHIIGWIEDGLADFISPKMDRWLELKANELLSKQRYNYADVRKKFISTAKIIQNFENPTISEKILFNFFRSANIELKTSEKKQTNIISQKAERILDKRYGNPHKTKKSIKK